MILVEAIGLWLVRARPYDLTRPRLFAFLAFIATSRSPVFCLFTSYARDLAHNRLDSAGSYGTGYSTNGVDVELTAIGLATVQPRIDLAIGPATKFATGLATEGNTSSKQSNCDLCTKDLTILTCLRLSAFVALKTVFRSPVFYLRTLLAFNTALRFPVPSFYASYTCNSAINHQKSARSYNTGYHAINVGG